MMDVIIKSAIKMEDLLKEITPWVNGTHNGYKRKY